MTIYKCPFFPYCLDEFSTKPDETHCGFSFLGLMSDRIFIMTIPLGPRQKIIPPLACLMARLLRYIHPHVSRYAQVDVPCRQTIIRRNRVELFLTVTPKRRIVMRGALLIGLTVVLLIIGILVMKNMGVDNSTGTTKTQAVKHTKRAESAADKATERIKDLSNQVSGAE